MQPDYQSYFSILQRLFVAGPCSTSPSTEKEEPWQGQSHCLSPASKQVCEYLGQEGKLYIFVVLIRVNLTVVENEVASQVGADRVHHVVRPLVVAVDP